MNSLLCVILILFLYICQTWTSDVTIPCLNGELFSCANVGPTSLYNKRILFIGRDAPAPYIDLAAYLASNRFQNTVTVLSYHGGAGKRYMDREMNPDLQRIIWWAYRLKEPRTNSKVECADHVERAVRHGRGVASALLDLRDFDPGAYDLIIGNADDGEMSFIRSMHPNATIVIVAANYNRVDKAHRDLIVDEYKFEHGDLNLTASTRRLIAQNAYEMAVCQNMILDWSYEQSDALLVPDSFAMELLPRRFREKSIMLPRLVDTKKFHATRDYCKKQEKRGPLTLVLSYVLNTAASDQTVARMLRIGQSLLSKRFSLIYLVASVHNNPYFYDWINGNRNKLSAHLQKRLQYGDRVNVDSIRKIHNRSVVHMYPSPEQSPELLQALSSGMLVVAPRSPRLSDLLNENNSILLETGTDDEWVKTVLDVLKHKDSRKWQRKRCHAIRTPHRLGIDANELTLRDAANALGEIVDGYRPSGRDAEW